MKVSVIVRVLNEAQALDTLLTQLNLQKFDGELELIVIDNESNDASAEVAKKHGAHVKSIAREEFSYPKASNLGIHASTGDLIAMVSSHAEMISDHWIANGARWFDEPHIVGVYGPQMAMQDSPLAEKAYYGLSRSLGFGRKAKAQRKAGMGVMGAGNCIVRGDYLRKNLYDEKYGAGGEDEAWGRRAIADGKTIIRDPDFIVRHGHRLSVLNLLKQHRYWFTLKRPARFSRSRLQKYGRPYKDDK